MTFRQADEKANEYSCIAVQTGKVNPLDPWPSFLITITTTARGKCTSWRIKEGPF